jgi:hypothetical protein
MGSAALYTSERRDPRCFDLPFGNRLRSSTMHISDDFHMLRERVQTIVRQRRRKEKRSLDIVSQCTLQGILTGSWANVLLTVCTIQLWEEPCQFARRIRWTVSPLLYGSTSKPSKLTWLFRLAMLREQAAASRIGIADPPSPIAPRSPCSTSSLFSHPVRPAMKSVHTSNSVSSTESLH